MKEGTVMVDFISYLQYAEKVARLGDLKPSGDDDDEYVVALVTTYCQMSFMFFSN